MALTLTTATTRVSRYLSDVSALNFTSTEIQDFLIEQNRELWEEIRQKNPHVLAPTEVMNTWAANTVSADLTGASWANTSDFDIYGVYSLPRVESEGVTNLRIPMRRMNYEELYRKSQRGGTMFLPDAVNAFSGHGSSTRWALRANTLYLDPIPQTAMNVVAVFLKPWTAPSAGGDALLPVTFSRWDMLVVYRATRQCFGRKGEIALMNSMGLLIAEKEEKLDDWLREREQQVIQTHTKLLGGM